MRASGVAGPPSSRRRKETSAPVFASCVRRRASSDLLQFPSSFFHFITDCPPVLPRAQADPGRKSPTCNDGMVGRSTGRIERAGTPKAREHSKRLVCSPSRLQPTSAFERCSRAFSRCTPETAYFFRGVLYKTAKDAHCTSQTHPRLDARTRPTSNSMWMVIRIRSFLAVWLEVSSGSIRARWHIRADGG